MKNNTSIEPLEPRIAPATISIVGKTATWTDFDGDIVTMKWTSADAPTFTTMDKGAGLLVSRIFLEAAKHDGASFAVKVKAAGTFGDGRVELGHLDGPGVALKSWIGAKAGISEVDLGNTTEGIGTLIMGGFGQTKSSAFTGSMGDGLSWIKGNTKLVKINGDIGYGGIRIGFDSGTPGSVHGSITITGSLRGQLAGGGLFADGDLDIRGKGNSVFIGGSVVNASINHSGLGFNNFTIVGDIFDNSATTFSDRVAIKTVKFTLGGSIFGGAVYISNSPSSKAPQTITVGGSIVAQDGEENSGILSLASPKTVTIKGSLVGANFSDWKDSDIGGGVYHAGAVIGFDIGTLNIGGSIYAGRIASGTPGVNGGITADGSIGAINIKGSVIGSNVTPAFILAQAGFSTATSDYTAIGKIRIKGDATHAYIAAGSKLIGSDNNTADSLTFANNPDAGIGSIFVGKNFVNSNVFAGVKDGGSPGVNNLAVGDTLGVGNPALTAKLGPVVIKGHLLSDRDSSYFSGFAADVIASITVNGRKVFTAGDGLRNFDDFITAKEL